MTFDIEDNKIQDFFAEIVAIGIRRHEELLKPQGKTINQSKAKEYLKRVGLSPSLLAKMVKDKRITQIKKNDARNGSVVYPAEQFYRAVDRLRIAKYSTPIIA